MHRVKAVVDLLERNPVRNVLVHLNGPSQVAFHNARQLRSAFNPTERSPAPHTAGDELERPRRDLLAGSSDADDSRHAPSFMARLERGTHDVHVAGGVEREVEPAVGDLDQVVLDALALGEIFGVHELGRTEFFRPGFLVWVRVDGDDPARACLGESVECAETDTAAAEDGGVRALCG